MTRHLAAALGVGACLLAACLLAGGCASLPAAVRTASAAPTAAGNRELAEQEAARLVTLAPVPRGAVPLVSPPRSLPGPSLGMPGVTSLVDRSRSWQVPMPLARVAAWLRAHGPRGLREDGSSSTRGPGGIEMIGYGYAGPGRPAWQSAELDLAVAPAGAGASVLRADAVVVWLDPSPVRDTAPGPRMRVTVAGGCPRSDASFAGVASQGADLAGRLLPAAEPTAGLECRYAGLSGRARTLSTVTRLSATAARQVAGPLARLPLSHVDGGVVSCPADDGAVEVVALSYPGRADVDLWIGLTGCGGVSNGFIDAG